MYQKTIKNPFELEGIGLHTGKKCSIKILPAKENTGINFIRVDLKDKVKIPAHFSKVVSTQRSIVLGEHNCKISTPEHLLAAALGLGIDNLEIEVNGQEIPAMDGSSQIFVQKLINSKIITQDAEKHFITISESIWVTEKNSHVIAFPDRELKITYIADFPHPLIGTQYYEFSTCDGNFPVDIAPARTFGFWEEIKSLWDRHLALGGNLENAIVIKKDCFSTPLRFEDEIVRHKCLDLIGDLALLGVNLKAHIFAIKSSHSLDVKLLNEIHKKRAENMEATEGASKFDVMDSSFLKNLIGNSKNKQGGQ